MPPAKKKKAKRAWQDVAQEAQKLRDESLLELRCGATAQLKDNPKSTMGILEQVLGPADTALTALSLEEVVHLTSSGGVPARHIIMAFLRRATLAQKLVSN
jgi:amidase